MPGKRTDTPPPKQPTTKPPAKRRGRQANPQRAALRAAETATQLALVAEQKVAELQAQGKDTASATATLLTRAERCDAIADALITQIGDGEFTLSSALDAARVAKLLSEISRLDRGLPTQIHDTPRTSEERLERFRELTGKTVIDVGSIEHTPARAIGA